MEKINLNPELKNYIEKLVYEEFRYNNLLNSVTKDYMSEEEWQSSFDYYTELYDIANLRKQFALEEIVDMYKDNIKCKNWYIDFVNCSLVILENNEEQEEIVSNEDYQDYLARLYVDEAFEKNEDKILKINSNHVKNITFQVTEACNMACTYCYQHSKTTNKMNFETAKAFIDMILDADELSNTYITSTKSLGAIIEFIGGEPFLEIELISKISQYFINELFRRKHPWAIKFMFSICTNGLLHFNPKVQEYFYQHQGHFAYNVSLDGDRDLHDSCRLDHAGNGTYDRVSAAIKDYQTKFNLTPGSKITISPENVDKIATALKSFIVDHNYKRINLNCVYEAKWTNEQANILYWQLHEVVDWLFENNLQKEILISMFNLANGQPQDPSEIQNWCGGLGLMIAVNHAGNIYPCLRYMETSANSDFPAFTIGDIKNGINTLPEYCDRINCMSCITRRSQSTDECFNCPISSGCGWCSAYHYEIYGTPNKRATNICCMHKAETLANYYYWKRMQVDNYSMNCPKEWAVEIIGEEEYNKLIQM